MITKPFSGRAPTEVRRKAGYEAEKQLAFYLDRAFDEDPNYRVLHGLRLCRGKYVAQIDHLVIHRFGFFLVESKSIVNSVEINGHGEFTRIDRGCRKGMPSPIVQARRQAELLRQRLEDSKVQLRRKGASFQVLRPFKEKRFNVIAAIADISQIHCPSGRPSEVMKAEGVVDAIRERVKFQESLVGFSRKIGSIVANLSNREKVRERKEYYLPAFTKIEIDAVAKFLLSLHTERGSGRRTNPPSPPVNARPAIGEQTGQTPAARPNQNRSMRRWTNDEEQAVRQAFE